MNAQENRIIQLEKEIEFYKSEYFLLSLIAHELRTKFSPIIGFSLLLLHETPLTEQQKEYINSLLNSGAYPLLEKINQFTDSSKLIAEKIKLEINIVNPQLVIEKILEKHFLKASEKSLGLQVLSEVPSDFLVKCDELRLQQILDELLDNAIRFTQIGEVKIISRLSRTEFSQFLDFEITDTGMGISTEKLAMLTEFFNTSKPRIDPFLVSLGLMNVKLLCDLMEGKISIESQVDKGSTFRFSLPLIEK